MTNSISILGSTGSIGTQSIEVAHDRGMRVVGLAAHRNIELLEMQARQLNPEIVCIFDRLAYPLLKNKLADTNIKIVTGMEGLCEVAAWPSADTVVNAVVGMVGLRPTLEAVRAGKTLALANKETLVTGGALVTELARRKGVAILPVDSEHSAIFQCLQGNHREQLKRIILTASGGPFYGKTREQLQTVGVKETLQHPNWDMGAKITVDSATLMNKGLELIEAVWLFGCSPQEIEIVVHRESVVHSAVEYADHSVIAQLGVPDMKIPIQYALTYPDRYPCAVERLSLTDYGKLTFAKPDMETFVCLKACCEAIQRGGLYPALVNGANEQAVELFLKQQISFLDIGKFVHGSLGISLNSCDITVEEIEKADQLGRRFVREQI